MKNQATFKARFSTDIDINLAPLINFKYFLIFRSWSFVNSIFIWRVIATEQNINATSDEELEKFLLCCFLLMIINFFQFYFVM